MAAPSAINWLQRARLALSSLASSWPQKVAPQPATYQPLVWVLIATALGIAADRYVFSLAADRWWWGAAGALVAWSIATWRRREAVASLLILITWACVAAAWHHAQWNLFDRHELGFLASPHAAPACIEAEALSGPRLVAPQSYDPLSPMQGKPHTRLRLRATAVRDGSLWKPATGALWLTVDGHLPQVRAGDRLRIFGQLSRSSPPANPGDFDFQNHARSDRQLCRLWSEHPDAVSVVESPAYSWRRWFDGLRRRSDALIWKHIAPERAPLASALLLGLREQMTPDETEAYLSTGMVHILSISGLHVGLLSAGLFGLLRLGMIRPKWAACLVALMTIIYAVLVEAEPPAVRATVMLVLICLATVVGRQSLNFNTMAAAALVVLALNPTDLFRAGPQLSFLCTAVLCQCALSYERREIDPLVRLVAAAQPWPLRALAWVKDTGLVATWTSLLVWSVAAPLVAIRFHLISPIGVLLTPLLAVPAMVALLSGFLLIFIGPWFPLLATPFGWLCDCSLAVVDGGIRLGGQLAVGHWWTAGPSIGWVVGFYAICAFAWLAPVNWRRAWLRPALPALCLGLTMFVSAAHPTSRLDAARVTFLSVGHGCATVIELPDGKVWLYDAGRLGSPVAAAQSISNYLWSRRVRRIEGIVISHLDIDHFNAVPELLERFEVGQVCLAPQLPRSDAASRALYEAIERVHVPLVIWSAGQRTELGEQCSATVLHPAAFDSAQDSLAGSDNARSLVWLLKFQGWRVLLTGDVEPPGLDVLLNTPAIDCDVVLAPHHGSSRSDPPGFAAWSKPEFVVFSGGDGRDLQAVDAVYARSGARRLHTARDGAITFTISDKSIEASTWLKHE